MSKSSSGGGGIGVIGIIGVIFVVLKIIGVQPVASWSWLWVLSPFWVPVVIGILVFIGVILALKR